MPPTPSRRRPRLARFGVVVTVLAVLAAACSGGDGGDDGDGGGDASSQGSGDLLGEVEVTEGANSTVSAMVTTAGSEPTEVTVVAQGGDDEVEVPATEMGVGHEIPLVGLRSETDYDLTVTAVAEGGNEETVEVSHSTGELPDDLPPLRIDTAEPEAMAPGITLFNARFWGPAPDSDREDFPEPEGDGFILGIDEAGEVVWYYKAALEVTDVSMTPEGTLLVSMHDVLIREIDLMGNTLRELGTRVATEYSPTDFEGRAYASEETEPTDIDAAHHELYQRDNGNLVTISTERLELTEDEATELCPDDPEQAIVGDVGIEMSPEGEVINRYPMSEIFDPVERPGTEMCVDGNEIAPPNWFYPEDDERDWTHANAMVIEEEANRVLFSLRHLDTVFALRYQADDEGPAGEKLWEITPDQGLDMVGGDAADFTYHQHAVEPQGDGQYLIYDNGNQRPGTGDNGDAPPYSRAVLYQVDEEAGTVEQLWEHRDEAPWGAPVFTPFVGDADRQDNGNVIITHGGGMTPDEVNYARIVEVSPDIEGGGANDEVVFDMTVGDGELGWSAYRSEHVPSLYAAPIP